MKNLLAFCSSVLVILLILDCNLHSQNDSEPLVPCSHRWTHDLHLGGGMSLNVANHSFTFENDNKDLRPVLNGWYSGIKYDVIGIYTPKNLSGFSFLCEIAYSNSYPSNSYYEVNVPILDNNSVINASFEYKTETRIQMLSLSPGVRYNLLSSLFLLGSVELNYVSCGKLKSTYNISEPDTFRFQPAAGKVFENNYKTLVLSDDDVPNPNKIIISLNMGLEYEIRFNHFSILPKIYYDTYLNSISDKLNWKINSFNFGIDFVFNGR